MDTMTTWTSTVVIATTGQDEFNVVLVTSALAHWASSALAVHSSQVVASGSVQIVISQQVTYDCRRETREASGAPLT